MVPTPFLLIFPYKDSRPALVVLGWLKEVFVPSLCMRGLGRGVVKIWLWCGFFTFSVGLYFLRIFVL